MEEFLSCECTKAPVEAAVPCFRDMLSVQVFLKHKSQAPCQVLPELINLLMVSRQDSWVSFLSSDF